MGIFGLRADCFALFELRWRLFFSGKYVEEERVCARLLHVQNGIKRYWGSLVS